MLNAGYLNITREELKEIPNKINESISKKDYIAAAQLVVKAQESLQGPLQLVEGLKDVKTDLASKNEVKYIKIDHVSTII